MSLTRSRRVGGFTVVELVVVVLILSFLAFVASDFVTLAMARSSSEGRPAEDLSLVARLLQLAGLAVLLFGGGFWYLVELMNAAPRWIPRSAQFGYAAAVRCVLLLFASAACTGCHPEAVAPVSPAVPQPTAPAPADNAMQGEVQEPAPGEAPKRDFAAHSKQMRERVAGKGFHVVVEEPFVVAGDGGKTAVEGYAARTVRWAVKLLKQDFFKKEPERVLEIWLFEDAASYRKHARELFGDTPTTPFGYYSARHGALIMNISTGGGTLVHEIVHPFVAADFPGCPAWLNEGLGSLFEQCHEVDGHIAGMTNWRLDGLQEAIAEDRTIKLSELVATTSEQFYGPRSGLHYAMARYLLYWLQEKGKLRQFYERFRDGAAEDPTGARTLCEALGVKDLDEFQAGWQKWVTRLRRD